MVLFICTHLSWMTRKFLAIYALNELLLFFLVFVCFPRFHFLMWKFYLQLFDGHNGSAAAIYSKENLLNNVVSAIPPDLNRDEWLAALPRALVAGFVKTDKDFAEKGMDNLFLLVFAPLSVNYLYKKQINLHQWHP